MTKNEIRDKLFPYYLSDNAIAREAYVIWEKDGRPDGEKYYNTSNLKLKEIHWFLAKWNLKFIFDTDVDIYYELINYA